MNKIIPFYNKLLKFFLNFFQITSFLFLSMVPYRLIGVPLKLHCAILVLIIVQHFFGKFRIKIVNFDKELKHAYTQNLLAFYFLPKTNGSS
jgi:hypothetical protein